MDLKLALINYCKLPFLFSKCIFKVAFFFTGWGGLGNGLPESLPLGLLAPIYPTCVKRGNTSYVRVKLKQSKTMETKLDPTLI